MQQQKVTQSYTHTHKIILPDGCKGFSQLLDVSNLWKTQKSPTEAAPVTTNGTLEISEGLFWPGTLKRL